jgi:hypothetical protein
MALTPAKTSHRKSIHHCLPKWLPFQQSIVSMYLNLWKVTMLWPFSWRSHGNLVIMVLRHHQSEGGMNMNAVFWDVMPCGFYNVASEKTAFFIVTAMKTLNLTWYKQFHDRGCICCEGKGPAGRPSITEVIWLDHYRLQFLYQLQFIWV